MVAIGLLVGAAALVAHYSQDMPDTSALWLPDDRPSVAFQDRNGSLVAHRGGAPGQFVRLRDLPPHMADAVIAVEDRNFRHHVGVNPIAILRAVRANASAGGVVQGGSTITQQLAKNLFLTSDRTLKRKIQELMLAIWLEARFDKDEILSLYLNRVYFGAGAMGVDAAARRYFAKPATDVSIGEAAMLAGLLKAPSRYAPTSNPEAARRRSAMVLDAMATGGFLTPAARTAAANEPIILRREQKVSKAPYFVDYVYGEAERLALQADDDIIARTTLDPALQSAVEMALSEELTAIDDRANGLNGAVVVMTDDGAVRAMAGGRSYSASQFNRAVQAFRQPGSSFKPVVYAAALENGWRPSSVFYDGPIEIGAWSPANYGDRYYGDVSMSFALTQSLNSVAVRLYPRVGGRRVLEMATRLGLSAPARPTPAMALGAEETNLLQLTSAYAIFSNGGRRVAPFGVERALTGDGAEIFAAPSLASAKTVLSAADAKAMTKMLRRVVRDGTGRRARLEGAAAAGKTGTSQDFRDAWFVGYAENVVAGVWIGADDNSAMDRVAGGGAPAKIWKRTMEAALQMEGVERRGGVWEIARPRQGVTAPIGARVSAEEEWRPGLY
ncbi:MAG: PBP1A family penicillin-binding protein [Pseudomonadota bacterium]